MTGTAYAHLALRSQAVPELVLNAGYDGVVLDMQHGELDLGSTCTMLRSIPSSVGRTLVRVPSIESGTIGSVLDAGAGGIIAPSVESAEQASALVQASKYAPIGGRSLGPLRPGLYGSESPHATANTRVRACAQIETSAGVARREEIAATVGLDAIYIGPADLALSLGQIPRLDWEEGEVFEAITEVVATARRHELQVGIFCLSARYARKVLDEGLADFVGLGGDMGMVGRAAAALINELKEEKS